MVQAIRQVVTVKPGGVIEIHSPELSAGERAEVIVMVDRREPSERGSLRSILGTGKGCFATPEEADAFLRRERDAWD